PAGYCVADRRSVVVCASDLAESLLLGAGANGGSNPVLPGRGESIARHLGGGGCSGSSRRVTAPREAVASPTANPVGARRPKTGGPEPCAPISTYLSSRGCTNALQRSAPTRWARLRRRPLVCC